MTEKEDKIKKIKKNVLNRHEWNDTEGNGIVNDFLQLSKIAENLKVGDAKIYNTFMSLLKDKIELGEECIEKGKRLGRLGKQKL